MCNYGGWWKNGWNGKEFIMLHDQALQRQKLHVLTYIWILISTLVWMWERVCEWGCRLWKHKGDQKRVERDGESQGAEDRGHMWCGIETAATRGGGHIGVWGGDKEEMSERRAKIYLIWKLW